MISKTYLYVMVSIFTIFSFVDQYSIPVNIISKEINKLNENMIVSYSD